MSVIVKGMEMPENCGGCRFIGSCGVHGNEEWPDIESIMFNDVIGIDGKRDKDCPLQPLPDKHGRLIEADSLKETLDYYIREAGWDTKTNRVLGWVKDDFIDAERTVVEGEDEL